MSLSKAEELALVKEARVNLLRSGKRSVTSVLGTGYTNLTLEELNSTIKLLEGEVALESVSGGECLGIQELGLGRV